MDYGGLFSAFYTLQVEFAVRQFQAQNGLLVTGIVDIPTWNRLFNPGALPAPLPTLENRVFNGVFSIPESARSLAYDGTRLWIVSNLGLEAFDPADGSSLGSFTLADQLPGFVVNSIAYDGARLWALVQGRTQALLQRYNPHNIPANRILEGELAVPLSFNSIFTRGVAYSGEQLWVSIELSTQGRPYIQPIDITRSVPGSPILFVSEQFPTTPAASPGMVWTILEGIDGDFSLVFVSTGQSTIQYSGLCGSETAFDGSLLWIARQGRLFAYHPQSLVPNAQLALPRGIEVKVLAYSGGRLWVADTNAQVHWLTIP